MRILLLACFLLALTGPILHAQEPPSLDLSDTTIIRMMVEDLRGEPIAPIPDGAEEYAAYVCLMQSEGRSPRPFGALLNQQFLCTFDRFAPEVMEPARWDAFEKSLSTWCKNRGFHRHRFDIPTQRLFCLHEGA